MFTTSWLASGAVALMLASIVPVGPTAADPLHGQASARLDNPFVRGFEISFAQAISFAGDVDGDGYDELLAAAPYWSGGDIQGRVAIYAGSSEGLDRTPVVLASPEEVSAFGVRLAAAGDIDADGFDDVIVGSGRAVYAYYGSVDGLGIPHEIPVPVKRLYYAEASGAGDVNGDGYDDVLIGDRYWDGQFRNQGAVFVFLGSASGLQESPERLAGAPQEQAQFGAAVAPAGDVNADGYDDVLVGAVGWQSADGPREGRGFVYLGSAEGLQLPGWHVDPLDHPRGGFGATLDSAGDVDRDGYDDVVFGAGLRKTQIYVYRGSPDGPTRPALTRPAEPKRRIVGFNHPVTGAGDLDGDGFDDIVVGNPYSDPDRNGEGRTYTWLGDATGLSREPHTRDPANRKNAQYGSMVAGGGDVNGDGKPDVAVSAPEYPVENYRGRVYVYY